MELAEIFKIIGITTGPQIFLIIIIGFWGKKLIEKNFADSIELKKADLQKSILEFNNKLEITHFEIKREIETQLQTHQASLNSLRFEHEKKYETKHQKTMDVIEDTYTNLYEFGNLLKLIISEYSFSSETKLQKTRNDSKSKLDEINKNFFKRKIYLQPSKSNKIQEIINAFYSILIDAPFDFSHNHSSKKTQSQKREDENKFKTINNYLNKDLPNVLADLEKEFRILMNLKK